MGGRAAERLAFDGDISTGAADDLQRATEMAIDMVTRYGMDATVGARTYTSSAQSFLGLARDRLFNAADETGREIDLAVRRLLDDAEKCARKILEQRRCDLEKGSALLLERETLTPEEFPPLGSGKPASPESLAQLAMPSNSAHRAV